MTAALCAAALTLCAAGAANFSLHDGFDAYTEGSPASGVWHPIAGTWDLHEGRYRGSSRYRAVALCASAPESDGVTVEAIVRVQERLDGSGWSTAGVMVYVDGDNFWRFILVASPEGQRYCELGEMYQGVWQAHREGRTLLQGTKEGGDAWEYGRPYALRIELTPDGIMGTMLDGETSKLLGRESYSFHDAPHLSSGRPALGLSVGEPTPARKPAGAPDGGLHGIQPEAVEFG